MTEQKKSEIRKALQEAAIQIIAKHGLERVTTKELKIQANVGNEAYIYRVFANKQDLIATTFDMLDHELMRGISINLDIMRDESLSLDERCLLIFTALWKFLLACPDRCMYFMQYYYSPLFVRYSAERHRELYEPVVERFGRVFKQGTDVWRMLNYILDIMLTMSIKVFRGEIENTPEFEREVFESIYRSLQPYLTWSK